jgi:hypothetical protein
MFLERNGILNSADYGICFLGLLGGEMDEDYKKNVNKNHAGKYGSFAIGDVTNRRTISGIAFHFTRGSKIIVDYDLLKYSDEDKNRSKVLEIAIELKY